MVEDVTDGVVVEVGEDETPGQSLLQKPHLNPTRLPSLSTCVAHQGVRFAYCVTMVHALNTRPLYLKGKTQDSPLQVEHLALVYVEGVVDTLAEDVFDDVADGVVDTLTDGVVDTLVNGLVDAVADSVVDAVADDVVDALADGIIDAVADDVVDALADGIV